jgi:hypothetical protein
MFGKNEYWGEGEGEGEGEVEIKFGTNKDLFTKNKVYLLIKI